MISSELRDEVQKYIDREITLEQLEVWFVPRLTTYLSEPESDNANVIASIELGLVEVSDGRMSETELRRELSVVLRQYRTIVELTNQADSMFSTTSSNRTTPLISSKNNGVLVGYTSNYS